MGKLPLSDTHSSDRKRRILAIKRLYHSIKNRQQRVYASGVRPENAVNPNRSSRLRRRTEKGGVVNVITVARQYQAYLSKPEVFGYRQVAENFGVTKATVSYYLSFVNRLPEGFVDWLEACKNPMILAFFGQKRLRAIIGTNEAEKATAILSEAQKLVDDLNDDESIDMYSLAQILGRDGKSVARGRKL